MRRLFLQGALVGILHASKHGRTSAIATEVQNVTLQNTSSELLYIPELCDTSDSTSDCEGGWYVLCYITYNHKGLFIYQYLFWPDRRSSAGRSSILRSPLTVPSPQTSPQRMDPLTKMVIFFRKYILHFEVRL